MLPEVPELQKLAERMDEYDTLAGFLKYMRIKDYKVPNRPLWDQIILESMGLDYEKIQEERQSIYDWERSCNSN